MNNSQYIGCYSKPDGYFGNNVIVHLCLVNNKLIEVYPFGFVTSAYLPFDIEDTKEANWLISNHPNGRFYS